MVRRAGTKKNGAIVATAIAISSIVAGLFAYYDGQASQYNYSLGNDRDYPKNRLFLDTYGNLQIGAFAINKGHSGGSVMLVLTVTNAQFTDQLGVPATTNTASFMQTAVVGDTWKGKDVLIKPDPNSNTFTVSLKAQGQEPLSKSYPSEPITITYIKDGVTGYQLQ